MQIIAHFSNDQVASATNPTVGKELALSILQFKQGQF